jgi:hypothetical protein
MANQLDIELRTWVQRFVDGELSMAELSEWFASATWGIDDSELVNDVSLLLAEHSSGDLDEAGVRGALTGLVGKTVAEGSLLKLNRATSGSAGYAFAHLEGHLHAPAKNILGVSSPTPA